MHNRPILCVLPAPRPLNADTGTGGAQTWTPPAGVTQVAFPQRGVHGDAVACAGVHARFGGAPVLAAPELPARIRAVREEQP